MFRWVAAVLSVSSLFFCHQNVVKPMRERIGGFKAQDVTSQQALEDGASLGNLDRCWGPNFEWIIHGLSSFFF